MLLCWLCVSSCVCAPWLGPFRRTALALHCTEGSSRGACAIPLGGCRLYSPECREGFFSETGFPINGVLGNRASDNRHSRKSISIHSHAYAVPGRRQAGLFSELPRRVLLGNSGA